MIIRSVQAVTLALPFEVGGPKPRFAGRPREFVHMILVRVETADGLVGWGEAFSHVAWEATAAAVTHNIAPVAIGRDATDIEGTIGALRQVFHLFGRTGAIVFALSGLEIALWDLAGKRAGQPVSTLLGGARRDRLPAYASLMRYGDPELVARNAAEAVRRGYSMVKLHEIREAEVRAAREAMGPDVPLTVDTNCPWTVEEAIAVARRFAPYDLLWLEEPVWPPEDYAGLARVRQEGGLRIATGENACNSFEFEALLRAGAADVVQPSVTKIGGIGEWWRAANRARASGVTVAAHSPYFGPGLLASMHLAAAMEGEVPIEIHWCELGASPFGDSVCPEGGMLTVPSGPGLGRDPDPAVLRTFTVV
ncbi:mandelate racemase/muconate lactonizing enzyme family protein [Roseomonas populi]|uniref:Mandelate racemase/muconate lactonizing enzyme family protein n=1 Tax=Roseomonas populi TaxID=3121582 RepID=A0ABT1X6R6_9PROT|nr:mandelate racemase/muconate lactonizing enzyme family protein [Roseomonas pecuniae]MCR0983798.1 mandelate racemase/muconate lactonizing enzyme family protein [Roseomonas pecuniae]